MCVCLCVRARLCVCVCASYEPFMIHGETLPSGGTTAHPSPNPKACPGIENLDGSTSMLLPAILGALLVSLPFGVATHSWARGLQYWVVFYCIILYFSVVQSCSVCFGLELDLSRIIPPLPRLLILASAQIVWYQWYEIYELATQDFQGIFFGWVRLLQQS